MEGIAITHRGMEQVAATEAQQLGYKAKAIPGSAYATVSVKSYAELATLAYRAQSLRRVLFKLAELKVTELEQMAAQLGKIDIEPFVGAEQTFAVVCERLGEHEFSSQDLATQVGEQLATKSGRTVDLKNPDITIFINIQDQHCVAGVDMAGRDLSKRHWRIFSQSQLRPTVARGMLTWGGYANGKVLLDPFCKDGAFSIGAFCMATGRSPHVYAKPEFNFRKQQFADLNAEQLFATADALEQPLKGIITCSSPQYGEVKGAEKNAKIAGIKGITFRRVENEWLDFKFAPDSIDCVVSLFPQPGARNPPKMLERTYRETLKLLVDIIRKDGRLCTLSNPMLEEAAAEAGFKLLETYEVWQGKLPLRIGVWIRH